MMYNLWFDDLLGTVLFESTGVKQMLKKFYAGKNLKYGLPLDQRHTFTIQPWMTWVYSWSVFEKHEFEELFAATYAWVDETPDRWPMTDWYFVDTGRRQGFEARSMWGGIYSRLFWGVHDVVATSSRTSASSLYI